MNPSNRIRGLKSKNNGKVFENIFLRKARAYGWLVVEIPPGCKNVGGNRLIRVKTPMDIILVKNGRVIFVDLKSVDSVSFSKSMCSEHQVDMLAAIENEDLAAGYAVWARPIDQIVFFTGLTLQGLQDRESLKPEDGIILGSIADFDLNLIFLPKPSQEVPQ